MAGADSTATALRCTLFYVMTNPPVWNKLQHAIDEEASKHPGALFIPEASLRQVPYLQATIKEGLRMWPPLTGHRCKVAPPDGWMIGNKFIPGGTEVGQCVWGLRHDTKTFGADAVKFRPDRWLEAGQEQLEQMEMAVSTLFGTGRHRCLGKSIAFIELNKIISEVRECFAARHPHRLTGVAPPHIQHEHRRPCPSVSISVQWNSPAIRYACYCFKTRLNNDDYGGCDLLLTT
jgi:cytochrome P450